LLIVAHDIQIGETNTVSVLLLDGPSTWTSAVSMGSMTSGNDRTVIVEIVGRNLNRGLILGRAVGASLAASPSVGSYGNLQSAIWRCDGGIDGVSVKLGTGNYAAGNFYLYGRA
jgi:hypothetical protein